jgi:hypothetical protein
MRGAGKRRRFSFQISSPLFFTSDRFAHKRNACALLLQFISNPAGKFL